MVISGKLRRWIYVLVAGAVVALTVFIASPISIETWDGQHVSGPVVVRFVTVDDEPIAAVSCSIMSYGYRFRSVCFAGVPIHETKDSALLREGALVSDCPLPCTRFADSLGAISILFRPLWTSGQTSRSLFGLLIRGTGNDYLTVVKAAKDGFESQSICIEDETRRTGSRSVRVTMNDLPVPPASSR